jgi:hypothetical protein
VTSARRRRKKPARRKARYWSHTVKTVSTYPPKGLFTKDARTIARSLASKRVSPKGPSSGLRMLSFFINRAGRQLTPSRRAELERAKRLMRRMIAKGRRKSGR